MYIIITEFQDIRYAENITDEELAACDDGILDVIDIVGDTPKRYSDGEWHELERWEL